MPAAERPPRPSPSENLRGSAWLIADMALNIWALSLVKWLGAGYPAAQVVFLRALIGLVVILPWVWRRRAVFRDVPELPLHVLRVLLAAVTLTASFFAIARVPLATFTAVSFTRPILTMVLAATLLQEGIGIRKWIAAAIGFAGVLIALAPTEVAGGGGLAALCLVVVSGSTNVIVTRRLRDAPVVVMMTFYTAGLALCTAPLAVVSWQTVLPAHLLPLVSVGVLAQVAQFCFLRAHFFGSAAVLSVLSYFSLVLSVAVGVVVFGERPDISFGFGAALVVGAAIWVTADPRSARLRS